MHSATKHRAYPFEPEPVGTGDKRRKKREMSRTVFDGHRLKGLSLWQPWGSLIAWGKKEYETRGWWTGYRGSLLICAAKTNAGFDPPSLLGAELFREAAGRWMREEEFPRGCALCLVDLVDCIRCERLPRLSEMERSFGNFAAGRFAWRLENVRRLEPVPVRGAQGLFDVPEDVADAVRRQVEAVS